MVLCPKKHGHFFLARQNKMIKTNSFKLLSDVIDKKTEKKNKYTNEAKFLNSSPPEARLPASLLV